MRTVPNAKCQRVLVLALYDMVTFRVRRSRGEMYIGRGRLCVCLSLAAFPHGPGCNLGELRLLLQVYNGVRLLFRKS